MNPPARVFIYGKSLILDALAASLRSRVDLELVSPASRLPTPEALRALAPDVVLFDLAAAPPEAALLLLKTCPELTLIGVDPESSRFTVWSARCAAASSAQELVQAIQASVRINPALGEP